ncbi:hypothetical protein P879_06885 [Paragonimus westermani]|uniref:RH2 domain-containing protein n=1 Tax=Paragonimus westermani TaxID=34504 RepID=A0A8T0D8I2_9TREM|nr:hypothetical protein P879_06885 [Paragonimus westermani]
MASVNGQNKAICSSTLSPRVYQLAQLVYTEFESLRRTYGETPYSGLLPLNLKMLEEMDQLCADKRQLNVDLNLQIAEKNDVIFQLQRTKNLHDAAVKRLNHVEDELIAFKKEAEERIDKLESVLRHHEMLSRNAQEHAARLEERDSRVQAELAIAHERYTELLRAYVDQAERAKMLDPSDTASQRTVNTIKHDHDLLQKTKTDGKPESSQTETKNTSRVDDSVSKGEGHKSPSSVEEDGFFKLSSSSSAMLLDAMKPADRVRSFIDLLVDDSMEYESILAPSSNGDREVDDEDEAVYVAQSENCTETSFGVVKEVEKLISENLDLCATKNALNVVKNDLIRKLDDVTGEKLMLMKEVEYLRVNRDQTREEVNRLVRQLNEYQKQLAHVHTRLKLYEDVEDFCPTDMSLKPLKQTCSLVHAASCSLISQECTPDLTSLMRSQTPQVGSSAYRDNSLKHTIPGGFIRSVSVTVGPDMSGNNQEAGQSIVPASKDRRLSDPLISVKDPPLAGKLGEPCFTKREMARVIAERNYYKENLLELQDAVRYMEDMRARRNNHNDDVNPRSLTTRLSPRNHPEPGPFRQFFSNLQSVADDFATGLYELFTELEPIFTPSWPSEVYATGSGGSQRRRSAVFRTGSSELRRMFSHLLGHAAGQGTEAVFGTGNDFAAAVTSQSLTNSIPHLLGEDRPVSSTAADATSVNDGSRTHDLQHCASIHQPESAGLASKVEGHRQSTNPICTVPAKTVSAPT